jgi:subtilase family serine protease
VNVDPNFPSWAVETNADVEYAHAMAPDAKIVLAVAASDDGDVLAQTVATCLPQYPGAIVSQSFGSDETGVTKTALDTFHAAFDAATTAGGTIVAGTGDAGATDLGDAPVAAYPASDPLVTAVGGTEGNPYPDGLLKGKGKRYGGEQVWSEDGFADFTLASGGAPSALFDVPDYQAPFNNSTHRTVADVSYLASINGGELIVFMGQLGNFGGTSVGPPHWAAIFALADQARHAAGQDTLGQANPALYAIAGDRHQYKQDFHDITIGNNIANSDLGYQAGPGYDIPTGLGTPDASNLIGDLVGSSSTHHGHGGPPEPPKSPGPPGHGDHHLHAGAGA